MNMKEIKMEVEKELKNLKFVNKEFDHNDFIDSPAYTNNVAGQILALEWALRLMD